MGCINMKDDIERKIDMLNDTVALLEKQIEDLELLLKNNIEEGAGSQKNNMTVLESVFDVIKNSEAGVSIATVAEKIGTETKQVSSALYKLVQSELVERISKGVYKKAEKGEGKG
jgi:predicted Rossmann fold nucleotide-binding protein DprA/Smf involved in DNA uptake